MKLVTVILKDGREIQVLEREVEGLRQAGVLKESKVASVTKEEKDAAETKDEKAAMERMKPSTKRPVNISRDSIKKSRP